MLTYLALSKVILDNGNLNHLNHELKSINSRVLPSVKKPENWVNQGVDCQILTPGKKWQKGRFRMKVSLEFCPNEPEIKAPESLLQEIARKLNEATS